MQVRGALRDPYGRLWIAYILVWLFEGAARKWMFSGLQQPLYFARVPIVALIVLMTLRRATSRTTSVPTAVTMATTAIIILTCAHVILGDQTLLQGALGARLFLELIMVPVCLAANLSHGHCLAACRIIVWLSPGMLLMSIVQVLSPPHASVNRLLASDGSDNFVNYGGVVRATGSFTSSLGFALFTVLTVTAAIVLWSGYEYKSDRFWALISLTLTPIMILTSGSRSAILGVAIVVGWVCVAMVATKPGRSLLFVMIVLVGGVIMAHLAHAIAPQAVDALYMRLTSDGMTAEAEGRIIGGYTHWVGGLPKASLWGAGLGNTVQGLTNVGPGSQTIEGELDQWLIELGVPLFLLFLLLRARVVSYLLSRTWTAPLHRRVPTSAAVGACLSVWPTGAITGQGSVNGFAVIVACLAIAMSHDSASKEADRPLRGKVVATRTRSIARND